MLSIMPEGLVTKSQNNSLASLSESATLARSIPIQMQSAVKDKD